MVDIQRYTHSNNLCVLCLGGLLVLGCSRGTTENLESGSFGNTEEASGADQNSGTSTNSSMSSSNEDEGENATEDRQDDSSADADNEGEIEPRPDIKIDLLLVVDNSGETGSIQGALARSLPHLSRSLMDLGESSNLLEPDVQIMVTTTDMGSPLCMTDHREPEQGRPVTVSCTERLERFTSDHDLLDVSSVACTDLCPETIRLTENAHFLAFEDGGKISNISSPIEERDIDGDGVVDSAVAQALTCLIPQGIDGCGFESPLESMLQALSPDKEWNQGPNPFLRDDAILAIGLVTSEADCSTEDTALFSNMEFWNELSGRPTPSSAICWNAGVDCTPDMPDEAGRYTECHAAKGNGLFDVSRYTDFLVKTLVEQRGKDIVFLGAVGVPIDGGAEAVEYRTWKDPAYPEGDILPPDWPERNAEFKQWAYGIGPGCSNVKEGEYVFTAQAIPPVRIRGVCEALEEAEEKRHPDNPKPRCCLSSVCNENFDGAMECLVDMIESSL